MDWYVIQAYSGYEQKVKNAIEERIELANMKDFFGEILVPTEQIVELKGGSKKNNRTKILSWVYINSDGRQS
jgi:transcriptional antiterminator NusG